MVSTTGASSIRARVSRSSTRPLIRVDSASMRSMADPTAAAVGHGALPVELGVPAHRGERGAQLVRGVGDELAHPLLAGLAHGER